MENFNLYHLLILLTKIILIKTQYFNNSSSDYFYSKNKKFDTTFQIFRNYFLYDPVNETDVLYVELSHYEDLEFELNSFHKISMYWFIQLIKNDNIFYGVAQTKRDEENNVQISNIVLCKVISS